jgi:predicted dehydrogenase
VNKNRIGIGFIGGGFITKFHIQSFVAVRNADILGVMSRTKASA